MEFCLSNLMRVEPHVCETPCVDPCADGPMWDPLCERMESMFVCVRLGGHRLCFRPFPCALQTIRAQRL
eukprot:273782-Pyramimonas_sp.AAC.1